MFSITFFFVLVYDTRAYTSSEGSTKDYTEIVLQTEAPSLISCSLKCRVVAADTIFDKDVCTCVRHSYKNENGNQEITLSGTILQMKELEIFKKRCNRIIIKTEEAPIIKNNLQTVIPKLTKEYVLSLDIKPTRFQTDYNVIHMTADNTDNGVYGSRMPGIWFSTYSMRVYTAINSNKNAVFSIPIAKFSLNKWTTVQVKQVPHSSGNFKFTIEINGEITNSFINSNPTEFSQVKCYLSDPWFPAQSGFVRNVWLDVCTE